MALKNLISLRTFLLSNYFLNLRQSSRNSPIYILVVLFKIKFSKLFRRVIVIRELAKCVNEINILVCHLRLSLTSPLTRIIFLRIVCYTLKEIRCKTYCEWELLTYLALALREHIMPSLFYSYAIYGKHLDIFQSYLLG